MSIVNPGVQPASVLLQQGTPPWLEQWARFAMQLGVKTMQIAERDRQVGSRRKEWGEFVNTWSSGAFVGESLQPAELGWGTHERHWPREGMEFGFGCGSSIYLNRPGCTTRVRS